MASCRDQSPGVVLGDGETAVSDGERVVDAVSLAGVVETF